MGDRQKPPLMKTNTPFLTAQWKELTLLNFQLDPMLLQSALPEGLVPDLLDGQAYASVVAFDFEDIRVAGVPWPGYTQFPELNLRVYVRCEEAGRRGVMFVRELIPGRLPALLARLTYNEPYTACPMQRQLVGHEDGSQTQFTTIAWNGRINQIQVRVGPGTFSAAPDSPLDWFKEQEWGFGLDRGGDLLRYRVTHPRWLLREVHDFSYDIDWLNLYGPLWAHALGSQQPVSVVHAIGSEVAVYPPISVARPNFS
jgi:uncharacterized protein YqjF (DUF2071 family)